MATLPKYVVVLMLENRSFDHMLGFSRISGTDAVTGQRREVDGVAGDPAKHVNVYQGQAYPVTENADWCIPVDPAHDFADVYQQLVGPGAVYTNGSPYPQPSNTGFVASYMAQVNLPKYAGCGATPGDVMQCFATERQLPVLYALASEFVVCDRWFASMPGPTWPNRFFVHAASSGGLDHSPSSLEMLDGYAFDPFRFQHGQVFTSMESANLPWHVISGYWLPQCFAMQGMRGYWDQGEMRFIEHFDDVLAEVGAQGRGYIFIEPNYGHIITDTYRCGTSQHAVDDATRGEWLLKCVYEKLRGWDHWGETALIVTWDEHGGFYDHVPPPAATPPGDGATNGCNSKYDFGFDRYGVRVPALLISPLTERNLVDGRVHDHSSVLAAVEEVFGLGSFTARDQAERNAGATLATLFTRDAPRPDCPETLPVPASSGALGECDPLTSIEDVVNLSPFDILDQPVSDEALGHNLPLFVHIAHLLHVSASSPKDAPARAIELAGALAARSATKGFLHNVRQDLATLTAKGRRAKQKGQL